MDIKTQKSIFRVGLVLVNGFSLMSYTSVIEPLRASNLLAKQHLYNVRHLSVSGPRSISSSGARIRAEAHIGEQVDFDLVLVIAGGDLSEKHFPELNNWLKTLARHGVLIGGVSGGPLLLAKAGLMEGRRMTAHWDHAETLASLDVKIFLERTLYVRDRARLTCAGGTAPLDMMHGLVSEHHGSAFADQVSDWFLHTNIRQGEQAQRIGLSQCHGVTNDAVLKALEAMENHIADPLSLSQLASLTGLGVRQLNRLFRDILNTSTVQFYKKLRIEKAGDMLKGSSLTVNDIALATGFANGAHLSRVFKEHEGLSPKYFRSALQKS